MDLTQHGLVTPVTRSETLSRVAMLAALFGAYAMLALWKEHSKYSDLADVPAEVHAALAVFLGVLLVFRINTAYARWWEARTLWGGLINCCRNLAIKARTLVTDPTGDELVEFRRNLIAFPHALKDHLRDGAKLNEVPGFEQSAADPTHVPGHLAANVLTVICGWHRRQRIDGHRLQIFDGEARELLDICGGCERIRNTRVVRSYRVFTRQCIMLYLATLPWGLVATFHWWTVPLVFVTAYFMLGLETVAEHVEEPFGNDEDDLDLEGMCETIDRTVTELMAREACG